MDYRDRQLNDFLDNGVRDNVITCDDDNNGEEVEDMKPGLSQEATDTIAWLKKDKRRVRDAAVSFSCQPDYADIMEALEVHMIGAIWARQAMAEAWEDAEIQFVATMRAIRLDQIVELNSGGL